jgi:GxxExxY protein
MTENQLAAIAVDIAYSIHTELGPGLLESLYEAAFCLELAQRGIAYARQQAIPAHYQGKSLGLGFRADLVLENRLII